MVAICHAWTVSAFRVDERGGATQDLWPTQAQVEKQSGGSLKCTWCAYSSRSDLLKRLREALKRWARSSVAVVGIVVDHGGLVVLWCSADVEHRAFAYAETV